MLIARVIGELVATQKHPSHEGRKVLLVQPLNLDGTDRGDVVATASCSAPMDTRHPLPWAARNRRSIWR